MNACLRVDYIEPPSHSILLTREQYTLQREKGASVTEDGDIA